MSEDLECTRVGTERRSSRLGKVRVLRQRDVPWDELQRVTVDRRRRRLRADSMGRREGIPHRGTDLSLRRLRHASGWRPPPRLRSRTVPRLPWSGNDVRLLRRVRARDRGGVFTDPGTLKEDDGAPGGSSRGRPQVCAAARRSRTSFIRRSSLVIWAKLPALAAATVSSESPSGSVTQSVRIASQPPSSRGLHHELLVGLAATGHAGRHERGLHRVDVHSSTGG